MSTVNPNQFAPSPPFKERVTNTVETKIAANPRRQGQRQADEGLATEEPDIAYRMVNGMRDAYAPVNTYERQLASGTRGVIAERNPHPAWTYEDAYLGGFVQGVSGEAGQAGPQGFWTRPQHISNQVISARGWRSLAFGERVNTQYASKIAPANGGRGVRNDAEVRD